MAGEYIEFNNNSQPALNDTNINRLQQLIKQDIQGAVSGDTLPVGAIMPFGSDTISENWLLCNGQAVSRTDYQELFNTIGITYGSGDGFTTFNLPDLQGKIPVGLDENDTDFDTLGNTGGEKEHTLTINEIPSHYHYIPMVAGGNGTGSDYARGYVGDSHSSAFTPSGNDVYSSTSARGSNESHNILQPYIVTNYIIKAKQSAGVVATVVDGLNSTSATDALSANQGNVLKGLIEGTILYNSESGTSSDISFTEDLDNYRILKIEYFEESSNSTSVSEIPVIFNKLFTLMNFYAGANAYLFVTKIRLENRKIAFDSNIRCILSSGTIETNKKIFISKVIGYK
jgi:microcystin-dependent protein